MQTRDRSFPEFPNTLREQTQANKRIPFLIPYDSMLAAQNVSPVMWGENEKEMNSTADISQLLDMLPEPAAERCARTRGA